MKDRGRLSELHKHHGKFPNELISELRGVCIDVCKCACPRGHFWRPVADVRMLSSTASPSYFLK